MCEEERNGFWRHKDGDLYVIVSIESEREDGRMIVWYRGIAAEREYCREYGHFLESFEPYVRIKE